MAGFLLFPAALVTDVGLRAAGRSVGLPWRRRSGGSVTPWPCSDWSTAPADAFRAAACLVLGESLGVVVPLGLHAAEHGLPRLRLRRRLPRSWSAGGRSRA